MRTHPVAAPHSYQPTARISHFSGTARRTAGLLLLALLCVLFSHHSASAQNVQFTQGAVGSGLDNSIQIPIAAYPGRGAASLPVSLYYTSKVWRIGHLETINNTQWFQLQSIGEAIYAEHSTAGWTTSLDPPRIEWPKEKDHYNASGKEHCAACGTGGGWRIARLYLHMPDGSTHELRKSDDAYQGAINFSGTFYAVDGSRLRYDSTGQTTGTLYMPDGARYVLNVGTAQFIDRNGNALNYNASTRQWTDTLGRDIGQPFPANPQAQDYPYTPPGVRVDKPYVFRFKNLSDADVLVPGTPGLRVVSSHYLPIPAQTPTGPGGNNFPQPNQGPSLFHADYADDEATLESLVVGRGQAHNQLFDPVVLTEVILPNGLSYRFYYNEYGEISKVVYPTGGYDQYTYNQVDAAADLRPPYSQANRGVTLRQQSPRGDGTDVADRRWEYSAVRVWDSTFVGANGNLIITTISPDKTRAEVYKRILRPAPHGHNNSIYWPFGYEDPRSGMPYDERVYAPDNPDGSKGPMLRRTLTEYELTSRVIAQRPPVFEGQRVVTAMRNARAKKSVSLILDTGGDALAKKVTYQYAAAVVDPNNARAVELTTGLDRTEMTESHFAENIDQTTARDGTLETISNNYYFPPASSVQTVYLPDQSYRDRNILGLVTSVVLKDVTGQAVSKTETIYDEAAYPLVTYSDLAGDSGYVDPGSSTVRGNPTTVRRYVDIALNSYLETHAQFDQCGNPVYFWNERAASPFNESNAISKKDYSSVYKHAYLTGMMTAAPDPSGQQHGSSTAFTSSSVYDEVTGQVLSATDANGQTTSFSYQDDDNVTDPLNRLRKVTRPDGGWTKYGFNDVAGNLYAHTETKMDATRNTRSYQFFDNLGRTVRSSALEAGLTLVVADTEYDPVGRVKRVSNAYRTTIAGAGDPREAGYWVTSNQAGHWTENTYDVLGRVKAVTLPDGTTVQTAYQGVYTTVTDQAGKQRRQKADALGHVVRVDEPGADGSLGNDINFPVQPSFYEYDTQGNVVRINQGLRQQNSNPESAASYTQHRYFKYDSLSRLTHERQVEQAGTITTAADPLTGNTAWSRRLVYDETVGSESYKGLLTSATDARGVLTQLFYDRLNRGYQVNYSDGTPTVTSKYDQARTDEQTGIPYRNAGRLTEVKTAATESVPETSQLYDYDLMGRTVRQRQTVDTHAYTLRYEYNSGGQLTSQTYPSGRVVSYSYDSASRLSAVSSGATVYAGGLTYKPFGGLESATLGNGALYSMGYDEARLQLSSVSLTQGATTVQRYEYRYGRVNTATGEVDATKNNGQVGRIEGFVGTQKQWQQRFSYDSLGRLSSAGEYRGDNGGQSYLLNYDYDVYGNRYQKSSRNTGNPVAQSWVEDGAFNPTTNRFNSGTTYDDSGNVVTDSRFRLRQFQYDANNRQKQSSNLDGSNAVVSVYDGAGQRVATKAGGVLTNVMVYDAGGKLVAEYAQSVSAAGTQYVMGDHQGSTRVVMNATGANGGIVSRHDYLPFGEDVPGSVGLRASTPGYGQADGVRHRYAGMEQDEATEMSHTLWRKFDSLSARWTSPDPYGGSMEASSPQSFNRYTYVNNDPVNKIDPTGLRLIDIGVYQTDNPAVAHRLEKAMVTYLRRYMEGQTGQAQRQQRMQQRQAQFIGAMGTGSRASANPWPPSIHDSILENALGGIAYSFLEEAKSGSRNVDMMLDFIPITLLPGEAPKHAMVPEGWIAIYGSLEKATLEAREAATEFIESNIALAMGEIKAAEEAKLMSHKILHLEHAHFYFGLAMHPIMDGHSPEHKDFQVYRLTGNLLIDIMSLRAHKQGESRSPTDGEMSIMRAHIQSQYRRVFPNFFNQIKNK